MAKTFASDINITTGSTHIDGKSIMGLFALDLTKKVNVEIVSDDENEIATFNETMKSFL